MKNKAIEKSNIMTSVFKEMLFIQIMAVITATIGSVVDGIITSKFLGLAGTLFVAAYAG